MSPPRLLVVVATAAIGLGACGGGSSPSSAPASTSTSRVTTTTGPGAPTAVTLPADLPAGIPLPAATLVSASAGTFGDRAAFRLRYVAPDPRRVAADLQAAFADEGWKVEPIADATTGGGVLEPFVALGPEWDVRVSTPLPSQPPTAPFSVDITVHDPSRDA